MRIKDEILALRRKYRKHRQREEIKLIRKELVVYGTAKTEYHSVGRWYRLQGFELKGDKMPNGYGYVCPWTITLPIRRKN